jgi:hypothetical protein
MTAFLVKAPDDAGLMPTLGKSRFMAKNSH